MCSLVECVSLQNVFCVLQEWYFVADPFEDTQGWQDLSPEEWTPRFEYGGNRIPIRAQVCAVCERDVCEMLIFKSDAHRAKAIKHCMQCGRICCMDC